MKIRRTKFTVSRRKYYLIIVVGILIMYNMDSLNLFKKDSDINLSKTNENKLKKQINIQLHISSNKVIKVNDKIVKLSDFKKIIWEITNEYSAQEVSGFIYNVYADDSVNQGFITDLFDIIGTTQDYNFFIKRVLH